MLDTALLLSVVFLVVVAMNAMPAFMPATWMVLAFAYTQGDLPLLPLTIGGAAASGLGRVVLAKAIERTGYRGRAGTDTELGQARRLLERRPAATAVSMCFYVALVPFPNSQLFIAAGMLRLDLRAAFVGFCAGRIAADTFWVWASGEVIDGIDDLFGAAFETPWGILAQVAGLAFAVAVFRFPWARWVARNVEARRHAL